MSSRTLLISDLHLGESRPQITDALLGFLESNKSRCDALYILGDLFDVWIGDDERTPLSDTVAAALKDFSAAGCAIHLMHGNRDFLLGTRFADRCDATLLDETVVLDTDNGPILLLHGDTLCIDDVDYMQFRELVRSEAWQLEFLAQSLEERRAFAAQARARSREATSSKENSIMDVNQAEVQRLLLETGLRTMIHGHTHRPAVHEIVLSKPIAGQSHAQRVVLGDWEQTVWYAEISSQGISLQSFQILPS